MGKYSRQSPKKPAGGWKAAVLVLILALAALVPALLYLARTAPAGNISRRGTEPTLAEPAATGLPAAQPSPTEDMGPVVSATGDKADVGCKASYTVEAGSGAAEGVVATAGERRLTNGTLQLLYLSQVNEYRASGSAPAPDFSLPLDSQSCPLGDGSLSWQHYFLQKAVTGWQAQQAVLSAAAQPQIITEEAYKPNLTDDLHGKYIAPELPVNRFLYQNLDCYTPNRLHQDYLDALEDRADTLARELGYDDLRGMVSAAVGGGVTGEDFLQAARDYNTAYMYFTEASYALDDADGQEELLARQRQQWEGWMEALDFSQDYSAVQLWADTRARTVTLEDTLYPDVAHQRFPDPIVYLQQDYYYTPFGGGIVGRNGCGITAFAMLATYMTDSLQTPAMMAQRFERYYDQEGHGTDAGLFSEGPAEMGFHMEKLSFDLEEVIRALENGQVVISLQIKGRFTSTGHFLLLSGYDRQTDTFQVRDSNIYNYGKLPGHKTDAFSRDMILSGGAHFFIMEKKSVCDPSCPRCGDGGEDAALCEKCVAALGRRNRFLELLEELSLKPMEE